MNARTLSAWHEECAAGIASDEFLHPKLMLFPPRWVNTGQPPFFILLIRAHPPMCGQESLGTLWENTGLWENWNVCHGCTAPTRVTRVPHPWCPLGLRLPLLAAGSPLHLSYILRAQPRGWHILGASKYCWRSQPQKVITSGTRNTGFQPRGKDSVDAAAES